jgi:hypothetical protein
MKRDVYLAVALIVVAALSAFVTAHLVLAGFDHVIECER